MFGTTNQHRRPVEQAKRGGDGRHEGQGEVDGHQAERAEAQDHLAQRRVWLGRGRGGLSSCKIDF